MCTSKTIFSRHLVMIIINKKYYVTIVCLNLFYLKVSSIEKALYI